MRSIFAGCVGLFLRIIEGKKIKVTLRKCLKVVDVKVLEGDKRAVCDTCRYRVKKLWKGEKSI